MLTEPLTTTHMIAAPAFFVGGSVIGLLLDISIRRRLARRASITSWGGDDIIVAALRRVILIWFTVAGAWAAVFTLPLSIRLSDFAAKVLASTLVLTTTIAIARVAADSVRLYALRTQGAIGSSSIFVTLTRLTIFLIGLLILLQTLGVSITPLLTALGIGGLAVALALQDTLANLFAGIHLIASRKVRLGDYIKIESGEEGYVVDINWRNTSIRTLPGDVVIVPNAKLANANLTNYYQPQRETAVLVQIGVSYESDLSQVERVTIEVAGDAMRETGNRIEGFDPFIRYHTFDEYSINFTVIMRALEVTDRYALVHDFVKRLHARYQEESIHIPFPIRSVIMKEPSPAGNGSSRTAQQRR